MDNCTDIILCLTQISFEEHRDMGFASQGFSCCKFPDGIACAKLAQIPILVVEELMTAISAGADEAQKRGNVLYLSYDFK